MTVQRPILFSASMVRALLAGTKTQTRRAVKPRPNEHGRMVHLGDGEWGWDDGDLSGLWRCPYGQPGDRLWVRETWMDLLGTGIERSTGDLSRYAYGADTPPGTYGDAARKDYGLKWRPSIHMPRAVCRLLLEVTEVRVERLQYISEADAIAEGQSQRDGDNHAPWGFDGVPATFCDCPVTAYSSLWESINGHGSWDANPWVWAIEFKRITKEPTT